MNKAELVSHVAAETTTSETTTRAAAERMVGAVLTAIVDALARDEPVAIAGFGRLALRVRAARQGRDPPTGEPVAVPTSQAPSLKPRTPFAPRSTNSMMGYAVTCSPSVSGPRPLSFPSRAIAPQSIHTRLLRNICGRKETGGFPRFVTRENACAIMPGD